MQAMGTRKGSKTKKPSMPLESKQKTPSKPKKPSSVVRETRSKHFAPTAVAAGEVRIIRGWEEWEDQLIVDGRKAGKKMKEICKGLPDRTAKTCGERWLVVRKHRSQDPESKQEDTLNSRPPRKQFWSKDWEDWEDQIVITHHSAGETWKDISKLLSPRSPDAVRTRWQRALKPRCQEAVVPRPQVATSYNYWKQWEEDLLKSLRASGRSWDDIASQLPDHPLEGIKSRWDKYTNKPQGERKKRAPPWKEWEERLLVKGYYAGLSWKAIAQPITGRTHNGAMYQWFQNFHSKDQDEPWTPQELTLLEDLRSQGSDWDEISQNLPGHTSNACRTQWYKETEGIEGPADNRRKNDFWSAEENEILVALYNTIGPRWEEIPKHLPGRSEAACIGRLHLIRLKDGGAGEGLGGPPSEYWKKFLEGKLHPGNLHSSSCSTLSFL